MTLLTVNSLSLSIHDTPILRDVSFSVAPGEILGVIGESGSGKSLTALSVMRLEPYGSTLSGTITLEGQELTTLPEPALCDIRGNRVAMIFQEPMTALNPVQTIGDQVAETILIHDPDISRRAALARAREIFNRVGLPEERFPLNRYPHQLSGGQRQRVGIACAIAHRPALLIADEPTTALDVTTQAEIVALLKELVAEDGMGLIFITHDLGLVSDLADRLVIMRKGEIVDQGPTGPLLAQKAHPYTRQLVAASAHQPEADARPAGDALLTVRDVVRDYPRPRRGLFGKPGFNRAVDHVSFDIKRGESLGLVGESGCGKSTLTRTILGLDPVQGGEILFDGQPVFTQGQPNRAVRRRMQVVFQDPYGSFNPRHRVGRLVAEPFHLLDTPPDDREDRVAEALRQVGLSPDDAQRHIHQFSGGQRQRIAIARALIIQPDLILLDEAVSALDVSIRAQVLDLLADLGKRLDLTYLFISHDLSVVERVTDRVLVMKSGKIVEQGPTAQIFSAPQEDYTKRLLAAVPKLPA